MTVAFAVVCGVLVLGVLAGERSPSPWRGYVKAAASTAFIATALSAGALDAGYGRWVLIALALSWIGDVALVSSARHWFLIGLVAFLLAHLAYAAAFVVAGLDLTIALIVTAGLVLPAVVVVRWLWPGVPDLLRGPVIAYVAVISVMVAGAAGGVADAVPVVALPAAIAFYLSDVSVARDRFISRSFANRVWGLPLYYAAQIMFAISVGSFHA
jgi:uncharacterized membrane protein YhhN